MSQFSQPEAALVLFSGGQDSTTCLAWALARFGRVETIGFDYGQRHRVEMDCRIRVAERLRREFPEWGEKLGADHLVDLGVLGQISDTALTGDAAIRFESTGLPNTFVPGHNLLFFTFAAAIGFRRGLHLVSGMCGDYSGYPVRRHPLKALQATLSLGGHRCDPHAADVARQGGDRALARGGRRTARRAIRRRPTAAMRATARTGTIGVMAAANARPAICAAGVGPPLSPAGTPHEHL